MTTLACSLTPSDRAQRQAEVASLARTALVATRVDRAHAELRFAASDGTRARVEAFVAAESACCPFFTMRIAGEPGAIVLSVDAPAEGESLVAELVEAFR